MSFGSAPADQPAFPWPPPDPEHTNVPGAPRNLQEWSNYVWANAGRLSITVALFLAFLLALYVVFTGGGVVDAVQEVGSRLPSKPEKTEETPAEGS